MSFYRETKGKKGKNPNLLKLHSGGNETKMIDVCCQLRYSLMTHTFMSEKDTSEIFPFKNH